MLVGDMSAPWWDQVRSRLGEETASDEALSRFKTLPTVRGIPLYGYIEDQIDYQCSKVSEMLKYSRAGWDQVLRAGESMDGHTAESWEAAQRKILVGSEELSTTPWLVQAVHHGLRFEASMHRPLTYYDRIVEIGAGIGEFARAAISSGFAGRYSIYDFPEVARVSRHYLRDKPSVDYLESYDAIAADPLENTLFVATWSLSEMPVEARESIVRRMAGSDALVAFQTTVWSYDNLDYFTWQFPEQIDGAVRMEVQVPDYYYSQGTNVYCFARALE